MKVVLKNKKEIQNSEDLFVNYLNRQNYLMDNLTSSSLIIDLDAS